MVSHGPVGPVKIRLQTRSHVPVVHTSVSTGLAIGRFVQLQPETDTSDNNRRGKDPPGLSKDEGGVAKG